jgi:hypothetical protein
LMPIGLLLYVRGSLNWLRTGCDSKARKMQLKSNGLIIAL